MNTIYRRSNSRGVIWMMLVFTGALFLCSGVYAGVPGMVNYQGRLEQHGAALTTVSPVTMTFKIFVEESDTGGSPIWIESQDVEVAEGMFSVKLGAVNPLDMSLFEDSSREYWLELSIDGETLSPRQRLTSVPFAFNAETLDGYTAAELDQSAHTERTDNPHNVTASQIGAATMADLTWGNLQNIPAEIADGDQTGITTETDPTVLDSVKDGVSWNEISDKPAGFADGIDNDSGGDIKGVSAGTGLTGGGSSGDVTLGIILPLDLTTSTASATEAVIKGSNNGNGYGVYGWSGSNYGVYGYSSSLFGIFGYSNDNAGVGGINGSAGNEGHLGTQNEGVYGKGMLSDSSGVKGEHAETGNTGVLGTNYSGVSGYGKGSANGVYGGNENGNYAYLGGAMYSVYSSAHDSSSFAGYFLGKTTVSGGSFELINSTGENWLSFLRGTNQNAGFAFKEEGAAATQWIFPYFRGWQSDNLIIRDETATPRRDVMTFKAGTGQVGIGTVPETLLHVSAGTSGDAVLLLEADTDNSNEDDQPAVEFRQDGGQVTATVGFSDSTNVLQIKATNGIYIDSGSGAISRSAHTGYYSVSPAAFVKREAGGSYGNYGHAIQNFSADTAFFNAPVNLPQGAQVVKVTCFYFDFNSDEDAFFKLERLAFRPPTASHMAVFRSDDDQRETVVDTIDDAIIDNSSNQYYLSLQLPSDIDFYGAVIEYTTMRIN